MNSDYELQPTKRINTSSQSNFSNIEQNEHIIQQQINNLNINSNHHHSTNTNEVQVAYNSHSNNYASMQQQQQQQHHNNEQLRYSPDLTESENPHYFNRNKLLYDLHMDKLRRADT
jgi:hypothetical protein